jgi:hypothetical protein
MTCQLNWTVEMNLLRQSQAVSIDRELVSRDPAHKEDLQLPNEGAGCKHCAAD